jgi:hypothetical protein
MHLAYLTGRGVCVCRWCCFKVSPLHGPALHISRFRLRAGAPLWSTSAPDLHQTGAIVSPPCLCCQSRELLIDDDIEPDLRWVGQIVVHCVCMTYLTGRGLCVQTLAAGSLDLLRRDEPLCARRDVQLLRTLSYACEAQPDPRWVSHGRAR